MHTRHMPVAVLLMLVIAACERGAPTSPSSTPSSVSVETTTAGTVSGLVGPAGHQHVNVDLTPDMRQQLAALHPLFARYHDLDKAIADGYEFVGPCVSDPALGGMGDHYSLNAEIDFGRGDGTYALDKPQYLVYTPRTTAADAWQRSITRFHMRNGTAPNRPPSSAFRSRATMDSACGCSTSGCFSTIRQECSPTSTRWFRSVERRAALTAAKSPCDLLAAAIPVLSAVRAPGDFNVSEGVSS